MASSRHLLQSRTASSSSGLSVWSSPHIYTASNSRRKVRHLRVSAHQLDHGRSRTASKRIVDSRNAALRKKGAPFDLRALVCGTAAAIVMVASPLGPPAAMAYVAPNRIEQAESKVPVPDDGGAQVVLDYGKILRASTLETLEGELKQLELETGWKLRVVTGYGPASTPSPSALQKYWKADINTIVVSLDEFKGNVLEFYYDSVNPTGLKTIIPKNVFQELRGRYGNQYFLEEEGTEAAVLAVTGVLNGCLARGGCNFVPGLSEQQRLFSLIAITSGAFLSGAVLRNPLSRWTFVFLFIWGPWIGLFGFYPLYIRQPDDFTPLVQNLGIFAVCFGLTYLTPVLGAASLPSFLRPAEAGEEKASGDDQAASVSPVSTSSSTTADGDTAGVENTNKDDL